MSKIFSGWNFTHRKNLKFNFFALRLCEQVFGICMLINNWMKSETIYRMVVLLIKTWHGKLQQKLSRVWITSETFDVLTFKFGILPRRWNLIYSTAYEKFLSHACVAEKVFIWRKIVNQSYELCWVVEDTRIKLSSVH